MSQHTNSSPPWDPNLPSPNPSSPLGWDLNSAPSGTPNITSSPPNYLGSPISRHLPQTPYLTAASTPSASPISPLRITLSSPNYLSSRIPPRLPQTPYLTAASTPSASTISTLRIALPYGCIYAPRYCHQSFETREEWIEHEKNAHDPHPDIYYCGLLKHDGERCDVGFLDLEDLEDHLQEEHGIKTADDDDLWDHNVGVHTQTYWCGFCREVITDESETQDGWEVSRFTHIGNHFRGVNSTREFTAADWREIFMILSDDEPR